MQDADPSKSPLAQNSKLRQTLIPTPKRASQSPNPNAQMEEEDAHKKLLQTLIPKLSSSTSKLSAKSRTIPYDKDFHFFNNFPEFKLNSKEIALTTESSLNSLNSLGLKIQAPLSNDPDEAYDWLVNLNDDLVENFNSWLDEFKSRRVEEEDGFQVVVGRKKKKEEGVKVGEVKERMEVGARAKVPFHIPSIKRPQDEYSILVNNANKPFEHVWLERSQDGERFVHPLEKLSISDFIDRNIQRDEIVKPLPIEITPFKLVEEVQELKELAAKLRDINEFAVDLEHNHYRSFQGLTCLMQISTRKEDFVIDTFKLRVHIGPYLREVFRDPSKRKVMHGADRDIEWLQRDFGIYVCNLFDTGQASRVMQLERNSLEYLLHHFCEVVANKEYQNADWRVRPLPDEMLMYAREDTHYLLYIYDLMRSRLLSSSSHDEDLLLEVYKRSYDVCIHLYERELSTDTSFLHIYGLKEAEFNSKQLAVADGLYRWRDRIARDEDESTGFILPNRTLLEIAKQMPVSHGKLKSLAKSKHSYVARYLNNVIMLIKRAIEKSSDYESIVEQLKARLEELAMEKDEIGSNSQQVPDSKELMDTTKDVMDYHAQLEDNENSSVHVTSDSPQQIEKIQPMSDIGFSSEMSDTVGTVEEKMMDHKCNNLPLSSSKTSSIASIQIMKKQSGAFGALLGHPTRKKTYPSIRYTTEQDKNVNKVEQIKSSVTLPFHSFSGEYDLRPSEVIKEAHPETCPQQSPHPAFPSKLEEVIKLENSECDATQSSAESTDDLEIDSKEEPTSLSDISTSFQQCFRSINQSKGSPKNNKRPSPEEPEISVQVKPFDYANARINFSFGGNKGVGEKTDSDSGEGRRSANRRAKGEERVRGLRRQAFPPSGNRSTTYK